LHHNLLLHFDLHHMHTEMDNYMPLPVELAHILVQELAGIRKEGKEMTYLRPDSKSQVTIEYSDDNKALRIDTIVISTQHDDFGSEKEMQTRINEDIQNILIPRVKELIPARVRELFKDDYILHVNPTGNFVIGGPHGDTGLTGRKIIVDTYGGRGAHGGGAFSGKDASKVDRSAAYAARHIAKNMVAAGIADEVLVQVAYAIGVAQPVGFNINTFGSARVKNNNGDILKDSEISEVIENLFDMRPASIIDRFGLLNSDIEILSEKINSKIAKIIDVMKENLKAVFIMPFILPGSCFALYPGPVGKQYNRQTGLWAT